MAKVELTGMEEMLKMLNMISERVATRAEYRALNKGADVLKEGISERAPRRTGHLSKSIEKSKVKKSKEGVKYIEVGPNKSAFYGAFLEFGTSTIRAKPFMAPALEEKRDEIYGTMADVLREELAKKR